MRPDVSYCEPWHGQNQPPYSPRGSPGLLPSGTQPRWVQTPTTISHSGRTFLAVSVTRALSVCGSGSSRELHRLGLLDLLRRAVADEHRLAAPLHGDRLADRRSAARSPRSLDSASVSAAGLRLLMKGQAVAMRADGGQRAGRDHEEVAPGRIAVGAGRNAGRSHYLLHPPRS